MSTGAIDRQSQLQLGAFVLRPMRLDDISQVTKIDALSFSTPWSVGSYTFEIGNAVSTGSRMIVLEQRTSKLRDWRWLWGQINGQARKKTLIIGYAGMWNISGEAHISTIAVHPDWRGRGLGEVLLNGLLNLAVALDAEYSILEVRVTNDSAQALYRKYGFEVVSRRKNYYRDNNEDAFLMNLNPLDIARLQALTGTLHAKIDFENRLI
jgi:ribosomal-protein-alanine N-acetyltransferase